MYKFPSIEQFHQVYRAEQRRGLTADIIYRGKIKLHGTNAGVVIPQSGPIYAQSRERVLTADADNMGFAQFVSANQDKFRNQNAMHDVVIYGEWAGPKIQRKAAVCNIPQKTFFVFAVRYGEFFCSNPYLIELFVDETDQIKILPWATDPIRINFAGTEVERTLQNINGLVAQIDKEDPYILSEYGVSGPGEGLVFYPALDGLYTKDRYAAYSFKVKGESHKITKSDKPARTQAFVSDEAKEIAAHFLTEARFEQALNEGCEGVLDIRRMHSFLKWIGDDVRKESAVELEAAGADWKQVAPFVNAAARTWFKERIERFGVEAAA